MAALAPTVAVPVRKATRIEQVAAVVVGSSRGWVGARTFVRLEVRSSSVAGC